MLSRTKSVKFFGPYRAWQMTHLWCSLLHSDDSRITKWPNRRDNTFILCPLSVSQNEIHRERERDCVLVAKVYEGHFVFVSFFWQYLQSYICIVMQLWGFSCYFLYYTNKQIFSVWFKVESHFFRSILNANLLDKPIINSISQNN